MMTRRENLLRVFRHEIPEHIPVVGRVDPYNQPKRDGMDPALAEALRDVKWCDESTIRFSRYLGLDIMDWYKAPVAGKHRKVSIETRTEGDDQITVWHTPGGDLRQVQRKQAGGLSYMVEHLIKSPADLSLFAEAMADQVFEVDPKAVRRLEARQKLIGDDGIMAFSMPGTPLGMLIRIYAGVENTAYLHGDAPDALQDLFKVMTDNHLRQISLAADCDTDIIIGMDDTSTTTLSPDMFEAYAMEYTNRVAEVVHQKGKFYMHHSCGLIRDLLGLYRQTKMDAVHALQIPPIGNVTIREAKEKLGSGIVICATANQMFQSMDDRAAVAGSIRAMYEGAAPGDNFMMNLAADPAKTMDDTGFVRDQCRLCEKYALAGVKGTGR